MLISRTKEPKGTGIIYWCFLWRNLNTLCVFVILRIRFKVPSLVQLFFITSYLKNIHMSKMPNSYGNSGCCGCWWGDWSWGPALSGGVANGGCWRLENGPGGTGDDEDLPQKITNFKMKKKKSFKCHFYYQLGCAIITNYRWTHLIRINLTCEGDSKLSTEIISTFWHKFV